MVNTRTCLSKEKEYVLTQYLIGIELVFNGWAIKTRWMWIKRRVVCWKANKVVVKQSIEFYSKA